MIRSPTNAVLSHGLKHDDVIHEQPLRCNVSIYNHIYIPDQTKTTTMKTMTTNTTVMKTITMKTTTIYSGANNIFCG